MDAAELDPVVMPLDDPEPGAPRSAPAPLPPSHRILVYAKDGGRKVRFISDAVEVPDGELVDIVVMQSQVEVDSITRALGGILQGEILAANTGGWHQIPGSTAVERHEALAKLFQAARNAAWADPSTPGRLEWDDRFLPPTDLPGPLAAMLPAPGDIGPGPVEAVAPPADVRIPDAEPAEIGGPSRRTRAVRVWTRERERALVELILTGHSAKQTAADPRIGLSVDSVYQHASDIGMTFRSSTQVSVAGLPSSVLTVFDRCAAACHKTRDGFVRDWMMKAASDPSRYGLTAC